MAHDFVSRPYPYSFVLLRLHAHLIASNQISPHSVLPYLYIRSVFRSFTIFCEATSTTWSSFAVACSKTLAPEHQLTAALTFALYLPQLGFVYVFFCSNAWICPFRHIQPLSLSSELALVSFLVIVSNSKEGIFAVYISGILAP